MNNILQKIKSLKLCLMAHPDNEQYSEFADKISDLEFIERKLVLENCSFSLMSVITPTLLVEMGFIEEKDESQDPRGVSYNIRNNKYHLSVDAWFEVKLCRLNPDTDCITLFCEDLFELESIIDWISD